MRSFAPPPLQPSVLLAASDEIDSVAPLAPVLSELPGTLPAVAQFTGAIIDGIDGGERVEDDDDEPPPVEERQLRMSLSPVPQRLAVPRNRRQPPGGRYLDDATMNPRVLADRFRMSVWRYSPTKARRSAAEPSYLHRELPRDIISVIFSYVPIADLAVASQTCSGWFILADPWLYLEHSGWVPLGPMSRAESVALRLCPTDALVTPDIFAALRFSCARLTLQLGSTHTASLPLTAAAARLLPPLVSLRAVCLDSPSLDDLRTFCATLLPRMPALSHLTLCRASFPINAMDLVAAVRGSTLTFLGLSRVTNVSGVTVVQLFRAAPSLAIVQLDSCLVPPRRSCSKAPNAAKLRVSCVARATRDRGFTVDRGGRASGGCVRCALRQPCAVHHQATLLPTPPAAGTPTLLPSLRRF
jgi:hypothetical protein